MSNSAGSSRLIWMIRHGERVDNIDQNWRKNGSLPRGQWDDPPLSARGLIQASEVGQKLSAESAKIEFILCSPFTRCLQTAQQILAKLARNGQFPKMLIEPGFCESLNACQSPPGFLGIDVIREIYPNLPILSNYKQFFPPENLPKNECTNFCCFRRVIGTLKYVLGELSGNLVVVSHGSPISAIHFAMTGQLDYMGQCTISKYQINEGKIDGQNAQFSLFLPIPGKSIRISALPKMKDQWRWKKNLMKIEGNGEEKVEEMEKSGRRNTMPIGSGKFIWKKNGQNMDDGHLAICLTRLVEATGIRAELGFIGDCFAAGDSGHLSDKQNLHDILCI